MPERGFAMSTTTYTEAELIELIALAKAEDDWSAEDDFNAALSCQPGWVLYMPQCVAAKRPTDVPAEVSTITHCRCEGGECSYCTCCELWNGEHSCDWSYYGMSWRERDRREREQQD
jgi:hypothetical protein